MAVVAMTPSLARARAIGACSDHRHVQYLLGEGGRFYGLPWWQVKDCSTVGQKRKLFSFVPVPHASDCIGFVMWCLGIDRYQPKTFPLYGGWMNTDSIIADARGGQTWWTEVPRWQAVAGDLVVYPSSRLGSKGHVGIVADVRKAQQSLGKTPTSEWTDCLDIVHCSSGHQRSLGYSISLERAGRTFTKRATVVRLRSDKWPT